VFVSVSEVDYNVNGGMRVEMSAYDIHLSKRHTHYVRSGFHTYVYTRIYTHVQQATLSSLSFSFKDAAKWNRKKSTKINSPKIKRKFK